MILPWIPHVRYLGVHFDQRLTWRRYVQVTKTKFIHFAFPAELFGYAQEDSFIPRCCVRFYYAVYSLDSISSEEDVHPR